jgi:hypothetical protein
MMSNFNNMQIPVAGSVVRVTTKHRNVMLSDPDPYMYNTYEGTVVPSERWVAPNTFSMSGDSKIAIRVIDPSFVHKIEVLSGKLAKAAVASGVRIFRVKSDKNTYTVTIQANRYKCTCVGFQFHRYCRHTKAVAAKLGAKK